MQRELEANYPDDQLSDDSIIAPGFTDDLSPIHPQRAAREIDRALPKDAILVSDIGIHHNWLIQFCQPSRPDSLIGSMGYGVAGVLGAKLAAPERPCVPVCGDGAFFMHAACWAPPWSTTCRWCGNSRASARAGRGSGRGSFRTEAEGQWRAGMRSV